MSKRSFAYGRWMLTVAALLLMLSVAGAQRGGPRPLPPVSGPVLSLMDQARANGLVAVIIEVAAPYESEARLSADQVKVQRASIGAARAAVLTELSAHRLEPRANSAQWTIPFMALHVTADGLAALQQSRYVTGIYPDELLRQTLDSSKPVQDVPQAHALGYLGEGAVVAVLDSGVEKNHEFLNGQIVAEACFSSNVPSQGATSICPNGAEVQIGGGAANPNKCKDAPGCDHGTHVSGIVAGNIIDPSTIPGSTIYSGIAPGAKIYAVQIFSEFTNPGICGSSKCVLSYTSDTIGGLQQVEKDRALYNIAAVNMSIGGGAYFDYCDFIEVPTFKAIEALYDAGVATIIASGNDGFIDAVSSPGCISLAITVGSVKDNGEVSNFTNSNHILDLWGIGQNVTSSVFDNQYESFDGTSMATPTVAGAWAIIKAARPDATVDDILGYFNATGFAITDVNAVTRDLIQVGDAVVLAAGVVPPANLLTDGGFEAALLPRASAWSPSGSGVKVVCDGEHSGAGLCYAKAGSGGGKLTQALSTSGMFEDSQVTLSAHINGKKAKGGKLMVKFSLVNGKSFKLKLKVEGTFGYTFRTITGMLPKDPTGATVIIGGTSSGKYYADEVEVTLHP